MMTVFEEPPIREFADWGVLWLLVSPPNLADLLCKLRRRFGDLPAAVDERIHRLSASRLVEFADALLDFTSVTDAEIWIAAHS